MPLARFLLMLLISVQLAWAQDGVDDDFDDDEEVLDDEEFDDGVGDDDEEEPAPKKRRKKKKEKKAAQIAAEQDDQDEELDGVEDERVPDKNDKRVDRFFRAREGWHGSFTLTSFYYGESAATGPAFANADVPVEPASPNARFFGDARNRLSYGSEKLDFTSDIRLRYSNGQQSGTYGTNEYDIREFQGTYTGSKFSAVLGRQFVEEAASSKLDGIKLQYKMSPKVSLVGFGGLYPRRSSRSIDSDYSAAKPIAFGAATRFEGRGLWGALGAFGVLPMGDVLPPRQLGGMGEPEVMRIAITSQLYWRPNGLFDLYHYGVTDVFGFAGTQFTNFSLGANVKPHPQVILTAAYNHVDVETLQVNAQQTFDLAYNDPNDPNAPVSTVIQNNLELLRISRQSARLAGSLALFDRRLEISTWGQYRHRQSPVLFFIDGAKQTDPSAIIPAAKSAEVGAKIVDRKFWGGLRATASYARIQGLGKKIGTPNVGRFDVAFERWFLEERLNAALRFWYQSSVDQNRSPCTTVATCFGRSQYDGLGITAQASARLSKKMYLTGFGTYGFQKVKIIDAARAPLLDVPRISQFTLFARLGFRY